MRTSSTLSDDKAVSEAISYVLIFGLITIGTAIIYTQGGPALDSAEERQVTQNAERAVVLVQERLDEMMEQNAPVREVPVELQDITVGVGGTEPGWVNVTANTSEGKVSYNSTTSPVYIDAGSRTIAYENGAVMAGQEGNNRSWGMRREPSWAISTNSTGYLSTAFLRTISTTGEGSLDGEGRVRLVFESQSRTNEVLNGVDELNITVSSPRTSAWESYLRGLNGSLNDSEVTVNGETVSLGIEDDGFSDGDGSISYNEQVLRTRVVG
jgi:hypothetical protein